MDTAFAESGLADDLAPAIVLDRAGDDLRRAGRAAIDQDRERDSLGDALFVVRSRLTLPAWSRSMMKSPSARNRSPTSTAWDNRPPGLSRRSRISPFGFWSSSSRILGSSCWRALALKSYRLT